MKRFFLRRWFLLLLTSGAALACIRPNWLRPLTDPLDPRPLVAVSLFLMGWGLESRSLWRALVRPWPALWAVIITYGALPPFGWLASHVLPDADLRVGVTIISAVPCTLASAVLWTRMAKGNEATALLVIMLTTGASWLVTSSWLAILVSGTEMRLDLLGMMRELLLALVVPVGLAQLCRGRQRLARLADRWRELGGVVAQLLILSIIFKAAVKVADGLRAQSWNLAWESLAGAAALCVAIHLSALATGLFTGKFWGFERAERTAIAFSCSQKTLPVAILLFDGYFKNTYPLAAAPILFYHIGQLIVDTYIADYLARRHTSTVKAAEAEANPGAAN